MKVIIKSYIFIAALIMTFALAGCGSSAETTEVQGTATSGATDATADAGENTAETAVQDSATGESTAEAAIEETAATGAADVAADAEPGNSSDGSDILIVYFSRTGEQYRVGEIDKGNTEIVAEIIADETGADMFKILPQEDYYPYTYDELIDVAKKEQNEGARPAYQDNVPDLSQYGTIFIGSPVWWGDWPMIMYTFFENEDLSGKTLIPFSTHEGSGLSGFDSKLSSACPNSEVLSGLAIQGSDAQNNLDSVKSSVKDWLSDIGY